MDIRMPGMDGLEATRRITADPGCRHEGHRPHHVRPRRYVFGALKAGASGFLLKGVEPPALIDAVRTVAGGDALLEPGVTRRLIEAYVKARRQRPRPQPLASRCLPRSPPARWRYSGSSPPGPTRNRRAPLHQPADLQIPRLPDPDQAGSQGPHPAGRPRLRERPHRPRPAACPAYPGALVGSGSGQFLPGRVCRGGSAGAGLPGPVCRGGSAGAGCGGCRRKRA